MGKAVFITGVSRGIGKALAEKFLKEEYVVISTSTTGKSQIKHKDLTLLKLDLSSTKSIEKCVQDFITLKKKIDILINNAGIWSGREDSEMRVESLRKILEVNVIGTIDLTERLLPFIPNGGKIINISSKAGSLASTQQANYPDYKISKVALNMYARTLAIRLVNRDIIIASIHPGWVKTDMGGKDANLMPEEAAKNIYNRVISLKETGQFWFKQEKFPW